MIFRADAMAVAHLIILSVLVTVASTDPCNGVRCQHGGTCEADGDTFICICADGYEGQFCQDGIVLTSCGGVECNRGKCEEDGGVARCVCRQGGTGVFCENDLCLSVTCAMDEEDSTTEDQAECEVVDYVEEGEDQFICQCKGEIFSVGRFCEIEFCEAFGMIVACNGNGKCIQASQRESNDPSDLCNCDEGYFDDECKYGPCSDDQCQNGGSCRYFEHELISCECRDGFQGDFCEIETCYGNSCLNGGTCEALDVTTETIQCVCPEGFFGDFCEMNLNHCFGATCLNGGTCIGTVDDDVETYCVCPEDYSGDRCQFGPCLSNQPQTFCQNGGSCLADKENNLLLGCECAEGFSGTMCEVGPCPDDVVCENGGVCVIVNGDFNSCRCPRGVTGDRCEFR